MKYAHAILAIAISLLSATAVRAVPIHVGYPPPGGNSYSSAGSFLTGTQTRTYDNFDSSYWDSLWWGPAINAAMDGSVQYLSTVALNGMEAVWTGTTAIGATAVDSRVTIQILGGATGWVDPAGLGITTPNLHAIAEIDNSGPFSLSIKFEAKLATQSTYQAWLPFFDAYTNSFSHDGNSKTGLNGIFYYTPPVTVPVPAALPLAFTGLAALAGMGFLRRRRRI